jgi:GH24 family phage-related lysozyme (muramidase)
MLQRLLALIGAFVLATPQKVFGPFQLFGPPSPMQIETRARALARDEIRKHEGYKTVVYLDSRNIPTVGIGHKVTPADNLRVGERISNARVEQLFEKDFAPAFAAALSQARELGKYKPEMIAALASVNFQLGTGWRSKFYNTWNDLKNDNVRSAIARLNTSDWAKQTPVRVASFIGVLQEVYS